MINESPERSLDEYVRLMNEAIYEAKIGESKGEVPIGAILINEYGAIISKNINTKEKNNDPCGHAEVNCLREAGKTLNSWRLTNCELIVTLEPCPMCFYAIHQARIKKVIFGAYDEKGGAISLGYHFHQDKRVNHRLEVIGGLLHYENSKILSSFFKLRRNKTDY